jgi:hypothetical protein
MEQQKTIVLNLTKQEAECLQILFKTYQNNYHFTTEMGKTCVPFVARLKEKIDSALLKKRNQ